MSCVLRIRIPGIVCETIWAGFTTTPPWRMYRLAKRVRRLSIQFHQIFRCIENVTLAYRVWYITNTCARCQLWVLIIIIKKFSRKRIRFAVFIFRNYLVTSLLFSPRASARVHRELEDAEIRRIHIERKYNKNTAKYAKHIALLWYPIGETSFRLDSLFL